MGIIKKQISYHFDGRDGVFEVPVGLLQGVFVHDGALLQRLWLDHHEADESGLFASFLYRKNSNQISCVQVSSLVIVRTYSQ